jgi:hypothetical protein
MRLESMQVICRTDECVFVRLPRELQRDAGICNCDYCKGKTAYWDTLAIPLVSTGRDRDYTYTVHMPDPQTTIDYYARKAREREAKSNRF